MKKLLLLLLFIINNVYATEGYDYAKDLINVMSDIKNSSKVVISQKGDGLSVIRNSMQAEIKQKTIYQDAILQIKKYEKSKDEMIVASGGLMSMAINMQIIISEQMIAQCEKILNNPNIIVEKNGTIMKNIFELQEQSKTSWDSYLKASSSLQMALSGNGKSVLEMTGEELNKPMTSMKITKLEREQLKKQIVNKFGQEIKGDKTKLQFNSLAVAFLYDFLNGSLKSIDE